MDADGDCFGESRLSAFLAANADRTPEAIRDRLRGRGRRVRAGTAAARRHYDGHSENRMNELTVVFRSASDIEARVVRGLLESHGIESLVSQGSPRSIFPVQVDGIAEIRISVRPDDADEARRLIDSHRIDPTDGRVIPLRNEFAALERRVGYTFRDPGLLEHALTHTSRANEDVSGGVFDNESLEFLGDAVLGFAIADLLFRRFPDARRRLEVEDEGGARLDRVAGAARRRSRPRAASAARARRGEDGRTPQAGAARRRLRGVDCRDLPRRRRRSGDGVHRAAVRGAHRRSARRRPRRFTITSRRCRSACSRAAIRCPNTRSSGRPGPDHHKLFQVQVRVGGKPMAEAAGRSKKEAEQEAARLALARLGSEILNQISRF